ncbi:TIGR03862 family flavoprotein [Aliisedimentitalea scapharcae]|uniref:TIGR03862 family flavoprotein n=1 Tax=Aliisedimentitalea scapharcae TaxID=1524259 RepID=A0ABZ2XSE4_9RHOB
MQAHFDAVVIGAGPAGLMAAGEIAAAGHRVLVAEAKPSVARKLLMAGKSGLNLTKDEPLSQFLTAYREASSWLSPVISAFDAQAIQDWAQALGQDTFVGSTGRVFPKVMKASPLVRAWMAQLTNLNVDVRTRWQWTGWDGDALCFDTPDGAQQVSATATVLALGGASWSRLGSDGSWAQILADRGVGLAPFAPANAALCVNWSPHMTPHFGGALKSMRWTAGDLTSRGEVTLSRHGLEGGGLYSLTPTLRQGADLMVDLLPDLSVEVLESRLSKKPAKLRLAHWLRNGLRLPPAKVALFFEMTKGADLPRSQWVATVKSLSICHQGLRPMDEAISTAGGVKQAALDDGLMLRELPGVFCAGEMLDWEAPTGGYLLTACFATGRWSGRAAAEWISR